MSHDDNVMDQFSAQYSALMYEASKRMSPTHQIPGYIPGMQRPMMPHDILVPKEQLSTALQAETLRPVDSTDRPTHGRHGSGNSSNDSVSLLRDVLHNPNLILNYTTSSNKPEVNNIITRNVGSPALPKSPHIEIRRSSAQGYSPGDEERAGDHEKAPSAISGKHPEPLVPFPRMLSRNIPPMTTAIGTANYQERVGERAQSPSFSLDRPQTINMPTITTTKMGKHQKHESEPPPAPSSQDSTLSLAPTPPPNSSRSSLVSEGSSYHSIGEKDRKKDCVKALFAKIETNPPKWHDLTDTGIDTTRAPGSPKEVSFRSLAKEEEAVKQLSGLSRDDFVAVQQKLLNAVRSRAGRGARDNAFPQLPPPAMSA
jgi:hypothetical protein